MKYNLLTDYNNQPILYYIDQNITMCPFDQLFIFVVCNPKFPKTMHICIQDMSLMKYNNSIFHIHGCS